MLAVLFTVTLNLLVVRLGLTREEAFVAPRPLSAHTRQILAQAEGPLRIVCFLDRNHPLFRPWAAAQAVMTQIRKFAPTPGADATRS